jgi:hypothetical protein
MKLRGAAACYHNEAHDTTSMASRRKPAPQNRDSQHSESVDPLLNRYSASESENGDPFANVSSAVEATLTQHLNLTRERQQRLTGHTNPAIPGAYYHR